MFDQDIGNAFNWSSIGFFEKKIYFHKTNLQKQSYIQYQTHYIQKKRNKGKRETRNIKRRKKKKWG